MTLPLWAYMSWWNAFQSKCIVVRNYAINAKMLRPNKTVLKCGVKALNILNHILNPGSWRPAIPLVPSGPCEWHVHIVNKGALASSGTKPQHIEPFEHFNLSDYDDDDDDDDERRNQLSIQQYMEQTPTAQQLTHWTCMGRYNLKRLFSTYLQGTCLMITEVLLGAMD